jgi:hypothetical protein
MSDGHLRCMLCSSSGRYGWRDNRLDIEGSPAEHPFFLTHEDVIRHGEWLRGMKEKFLARRKELKAATHGHIRTGTWVRPAKSED